MCLPGSDLYYLYRLAAVCGVQRLINTGFVIWCFDSTPTRFRQPFLTESLTCEFQYRTVYSTDWNPAKVFHGFPLALRYRMGVDARYDFR